MRKKQLKKEYVYHSGLAEQIAAFIEEKHRLGYKYGRESLELQNLDRFCLKYDCVDTLPEDLVLAWTKQQAHQSAQTINFRICIARGFASFMRRNGYSAYLMPKYLSPKETHEHTPHIFSHVEINRLFQAIDSIRYNALSPKRYLIYPLLFRFLYCCGLRISEALNIKLGNVDIQNGTLLIVDGKGYRDRLVPMDPTLCENCIRYIQQTFTSINPEQYFFPAPDGLPYHVYTIRATFRGLLWEAGISYGGKNVGPRLHDLRHTFAVVTVKQKSPLYGK